jgi:hypothetical protein
MSARILAMDPKDQDRSGQRRPTGDSDTTISIDIAEWLRGLGLEQYAPAFAENAIDWKVREVIGAYHRCVADTVARFAGFVAKYMGDGVLVYFGYPEAHEDDAERALRAGLAVIDAVGRLATPERLRVRLGIIADRLSDCGLAIAKIAKPTRSTQ